MIEYLYEQLNSAGSLSAAGNHWLDSFDKKDDPSERCDNLDNTLLFGRSINMQPQRKGKLRMLTWIGEGETAVCVDLENVVAVESDGPAKCRITLGCGEKIAANVPMGRVVALVNSPPRPKAK